MRIVRSAILISFIVLCTLLAGARVAHGQTVTNPSAIEFTSVDHTAAVLTGYRVCFYNGPAATVPVRCNDVPKAQAVLQTGSVYRLPRASWQAGLSNLTDYWPRVLAMGTSANSPEVAPLAAPFSFRLDPAPRAVSDVSLVP